MGRDCASMSSTIAAVLVAVLPVVLSHKYQVCVVDGRGAFKKANKYCPILDSPDSKVECVIGLDRLDCLRKIAKGSADFSIFNPEDLVAAANSQVEMLVTNEMRFANDSFEYEVVAVIDDSAGITSSLQGKKLCHPGYGYETDWTRILANFLESSVVPRNCNPSLTLTENRIKASSEFFKAACKAGPWVNDPDLDRELKGKYPNLCELCDSPARCSTNDKYWGRRGPLYCLTDGSGDISWARLDDVRSHFGLDGEATRAASPEGYSFFCPDGRIMAVNSSSQPCLWVVKPWPVVATRRTVALDIQDLVSSLNHANPFSWQSALLDLIETYHINIVKLDTIEATGTYLEKARGFLSANRFMGCQPPRTIRMCTTSNVENAKCNWLREAATVYGVEPDIDCLKANDKEHCLEAVRDNKVDIVVISPDDAHKAERLYQLKTLFYETVRDQEKYIAVGIVRKKDGISSFSDLRGKKACFPVYDGIAWNSVINVIRKKNLLNTCSNEQLLYDFFGDSCVPGVPENRTSSNLNALCKDDFLSDGDMGPLRCLTSGAGDVAFVSKNSLEKFFKDVRETKNLKMKQSDFEILCANEDGSDKECHLSWAPVGQAMVRAHSSDLWLEDTLDVFLQMDNLFGKNHRSLTTSVSLFGLFDGRPNVLFHDVTYALREEPHARNIDMMSKPYNEILKDVDLLDGHCSSSARLRSWLSPILLAIGMVQIVLR